MTMSSNEPQAIKLFGKTIVQSNNNNKSIDQSSTSTSSSSEVEETAPSKAGPAKVLPCPRCKSKETKFCYFNNYNVNQPRHFCKSCHRYWTAGGTLRSVPVGAGRRKNRVPPVAADESGRSVDVHEEIN